MPAPHPVRLFHITAIANLPAIFAAGALLSKNAGASAGIGYQNIAHRGAQGARALRAVPPGGVVHDYVPFYFAPRSPMLFAINSGRVQGCSLRQDDIAHLETTVERATEAGVPYVFYDRNATLAFAQAYTDLAQLDQVAWDLLTEEPRLDGFCRYWHNRSDPARYTDRMERRQAEFLIRDRVPLGRFIRVGVMAESRAATVRAMASAAGIHLHAVVMRDWYF